jgi:hypothetical protein
MKKIIGWVFLFVGVLIIIGGIWESYQIFNAQKSVPEIFKFQKEMASPVANSPKGLTKSPEEKISQEIKQTIQGQLEKMLPSDFVVKFLNLISWSIFATFLVFAGGKLSELGIKLLNGK